jgi:sugar phosphate isomerase/epimerase
MTMKIGLMTAAFPNLSLEELATWASDNGFEMLEVCCWPTGQGTDRKYGGVAHIDVDSLTPARASEINGMLAEKGLGISSLAYYPNPLHPDLEHREHVVAHLKKVILGAEMLGVDIVGTFVGRWWNPELTGRDWNKHLDHNFGEFMKVWPGLIEFAGEHGVKIAIENCPMLWTDTWPGGSNLAYAPALIRRMMDAIPEKSFGLNFDPSHLVWQQIDYVRFIYDFADRIFHVHAKDMDIDEDMLYQDGILGCGFRWQIPRLPGLGLVDWQQLVAALYDVGYDFVLSIEHEDANWEASEDLVKRGFLLAKKTLELYTV